MYTAELTFECYQDTTITAVERAISQYLEALRYNGQILGREFPTSMQEGVFVARVVCPEGDSVSERNHSLQVKKLKALLHSAGVLEPKVRVTGQDLFSDHTDNCQERSWQILFTTFLSTCSPLRCGEDFAPIPLYWLPEPVANGDHKAVLKWQQEWCAADELQMGGSVLEHETLDELGTTQSRLFRRGYDLAKRIAYISKTPTYYYLYRIGGASKEQELARLCPRCGGEWRLEQPIHDIFDFKCDKCLLVSNLSWDFK
ncbi:Zn-ribbon-containing protein [Dongshaea marina]|uniref:Zn-ribbon-containing protein n=1 Tax=Dongshaea marina TaxID=2047966 RepID=UPI000D3E34E4|nr:Zn-ribbon-containing protein [Dongshaea marina]